MNTLLKHTLAGLLPLMSLGQALACYTVYGPGNQVVYHAAAAPVDMRYQLHQTLPRFYPGGHLVFSITDSDCPAVNVTRVTSAPTAVRALSSRASYTPPPGEVTPPRTRAGNTMVISPQN